MIGICIAPADEAAQAIVCELNSDFAYVLEFDATYSRVLVDAAEQIDGLRVDVVIDTESQPAETLDLSDNAVVKLRVWVRSPLPQDDAQTIADLSLLVRQIYAQLNNFDSNQKKVQVWECDIEEHDEPKKVALKQAGLFEGSIIVKVEVTQ